MPHMDGVEAVGILHQRAPLIQVIMLSTFDDEEYVLQALRAGEIDILRLVATGSTNREIASRLFLSEGTVKNHISRILSRLGLRDRTHAATYAHDHGLLPHR
jgi:DNA-binding NarL/FixJ family response regulator